MAAKKADEPYKLNLTGPGLTLAQDIDKDVAAKIVAFVMGGAEGLERSDTGSTGATSTVGKVAPGGQLTPKLFMAQKKPENDYERIACLAFYLTNDRGTPHFKTADLTKLNTEAAARPFSNPTVAVMHATGRYHYLTSAGGGKKQITSFGEEIVQALPDRTKVKQLLSEHRPRKKTARRRTKTK
jgi:hypothetical protein